MKCYFRLLPFQCQFLTSQNVLSVRSPCWKSTRSADYKSTQRLYATQLCQRLSVPLQWKVHCREVWPSRYNLPYAPVHIQTSAPQLPQVSSLTGKEYRKEHQDYCAAVKHFLFPCPKGIHIPVIIFQSPGGQIKKILADYNCLLRNDLYLLQWQSHPAIFTVNSFFHKQFPYSSICTNN